MTQSIPDASLQRVYADDERSTQRMTQCQVRDPNLARVPTIADVVPLSEIMTRDITVARANLDVRHIPDLMARHRIGCVPVVDERGRPIGTITKSDVIARLVTPGSDVPHMAADLMVPITIAVNERSTIAQAAALMASEDVHHLLIVDLDGLLIGVVTTLDIVRWLARNDGFAP